MVFIFLCFFISGSRGFMAEMVHGRPPDLLRAPLGVARRERLPQARRGRRAVVLPDLVDLVRTGRCVVEPLAGEPPVHDAVQLHYRLGRLDQRGDAVEYRCCAARFVYTGIASSAMTTPPAGMMTSAPASYSRRRFHELPDYPLAGLRVAKPASRWNVRSTVIRAPPQAGSPAHSGRCCRRCAA